jgi:hypothetical protein
MTRTRLATGLLLGSLLLTPGCRSNAPTEPFGAHYQVSLSPDPPTLTGSAFSLTVTYGGCRGNHTFALRTRLENGDMSLWLQKLTPDEPCDMLVTERRTFDLPPTVSGAASVTLLAPEIDPFRLRP